MSADLSHHATDRTGPARPGAGVPGLPVLAMTLRRERRGLAVWALALAAVSGLYAGLWPTIRDDPALAQLKARSMGRAGSAMGLDSMTSAAGYLDATVYGLLGPLLLIVAAVIWGSRAVAGDDEQGLLDLTLAQPVGRRRYVAERLAALALEVGVLACVAGAVVLLLNALQGDGLEPLDLVTAAIGLWLVGLAFGVLALTLGAVVGRRGLVVGATSGVALLTYLAYAFSTQVASLHGLRWVSPFWWFIGHTPAAGGLGAGALLVLLAVPALLAALAVPLFERRDVGV